MMDGAMNERAVVGHNNPPDPIDEALAPYGDTISEAENWLDGERVENEAQMKAVDALRKAMRECRLSLEKGQKAATAPLHAVYKAELDRWKPSIEDTKRIEAGLVSVVDTFKRELDERKRAEERAAWEAANKARREAEAKAAAADTANIEQQREAEEAKRAAMEAEKAAQAAKRDQVKGLRTVTHYEVTDHKKLLHWIAANHRDDLTAFVDQWAQKNHKTNAHADGLRVWECQEAY
ncbi:hypothetical protein [Tropicimonas sp. IMCC34011]|uniref:hypothetical protein n=1 Tax=Tropicimonas sp. IMCC34011 TaxID=2248759 RepID=UPI001E56D59E|nr:hypothetical protein [Tropicimonas sp. IMCC34011]